MRGIGDRLDKITRIKILQEKAYKYNEEFDKLEEQGLDPEIIQRQLQDKEKQSRHTNDDKNVLPFEESRKVIKVGGITDFGFDKSHSGKTESQQMQETMKNIVKKKQELKQQGLKDPEDDLKKKFKENDEKMKKKIYQDHIVDMFSADTGQKKAIPSNHQENYVFTDDMQKDVDNHDLTYHQRKNDLKWYSEAYVKYKSTMRK